MIRVVDYYKIYRDLVAVAGLSFEVRSGAILGLVGPNGAGKTTTLRALAGIIPPTRGRLLIAGHDIVADPVAAKRQLAYVPDDPKLFDTLTGLGTSAVHRLGLWRRGLRAQGPRSFSTPSN